MPHMRRRGPHLQKLVAVVGLRLGRWTPRRPASAGATCTAPTAPPAASLRLAPGRLEAQQVIGIEEAAPAWAAAHQTLMRGLARLASRPASCRTAADAVADAGGIVMPTAAATAATAVPPRPVAARVAMRLELTRQATPTTAVAAVPTLTMSLADRRAHSSLSSGQPEPAAAGSAGGEGRRAHAEAGPRPAGDARVMLNAISMVALCCRALGFEVAGVSP